MEGSPIAKLKTPRIAHADVSNTDRISNLPVQILELILSYLPIRDIVRTSILSSNWRNKWATVPKLLFDKSCSSAVIDHVLLFHTGPIEIFKIKGIRAIPDIDRWVFHVCRKPIKELTLEFSDQQYKLLSCLSKSESLVKLKLYDCLLSLPACFEGFKSLKCLCLDVSMDKDAFERLISSCPLLETLVFNESTRYYDNLKINAPSLRHLEICGIFGDITFGHPTDRLLVFYFAQNIDVRNYLRTSLTEILTNLPSIQRLALIEGSLSALTSGLTPDSVPVQCEDLYFLKISLNSGRLNDCLAALYLFKCSPDLTELEIEVFQNLTGDPGLWGDIRKCYWEFKKLRWVKLDIVSISPKVGGLELIHFLLASSPVLEEMTLIPFEDADYMDPEDVKRLGGFKRASAKAKIILDGHLIQ